MTLVDVNWTDFRLSLQTAYPDLNPRNRYSKQRLYECIRQHSQARIRDELNVLRYYRHFNFLTKSLLDSHRLTEEERDQAFCLSGEPENHSNLPKSSTPQSCFLDSTPAPFPLWEDQLTPHAHASRADVPDHIPSPWDARDPREPERDWRASERDREPSNYQFREASRPLEPAPPPRPPARVETRTVRFKEPVPDEAPEDLIDKMH